MNYKTLSLVLALLILFVFGGTVSAEEIGIVEALRIDKVTSSEVVLKWNKFDGASKYNIYRQETVPTTDECFIATAAYGSSLSSSVVLLRQFRDTYLVGNKTGSFLVEQYYKHSPALAESISKSETLKTITRIALLPFILVAFAAINLQLLIKGALLLFLLALAIKKRCIPVRNISAFMLVFMLLCSMVYPAPVAAQTTPTDGYGEPIFTTEELTYTDTNIIPDKTYRYIVKAMSAKQVLAYSEPLKVTTSKSLSSLLDDNLELDTDGDGKIELIEDTEIILETDEDTGDWTTQAVTAPDFEYIIRYVARVLPVQVGPYTVQANDIAIHENRAYVAYNKAGPVFAGAVQVIDITTPRNPRVLSELKLNGMGINTLYYDNERDELIFGGSADFEVFGFRSFISSFNPAVQDYDTILSHISASLTSLPSYHLTAITKIEGTDRYYAGVGAEDGELLELDRDFNITAKRQVSDIRDIDTYPGGFLALAGTTHSPAQSGRILRSMTDEDQDLAIGDFASPEHKAVIKAYAGEPKIMVDEDVLAFMALSQRGFHVWKIGGSDLAGEQGRLIFNLENPPGVHTETNSVSYSGGFAFLANGGYGFRILRVNGYAHIADESNAEAVQVLPFAELVGRHELKGAAYKDDYSANHIEYQQQIREIAGRMQEENVLFVAGGTSGVNIYTLSHQEDFFYIEPDTLTLEQIAGVLHGDARLLDEDPLINPPDHLAPGWEIGLRDWPAELGNYYLTITFLDETAGFKNQLGYFTYEGESRDIIGLEQIAKGETLIFANASRQGSGGSLLPGYSRTIGPFNPAHKVGFYLRANGYNVDNPREYYTLKALHQTDYHQFGMFLPASQSGAQKIVFCVEDLRLPSGDRDFTDLVFQVEVERSPGIPLELELVNLQGVSTAAEIIQWLQSQVPDPAPPAEDPEEPLPEEPDKLHNAALDPSKFSAGRTDAGSPSNLAESHEHDNKGIWQINVGGEGLTETIDYDFTTPQTVVHYALRATSDGSRAPKNWKLQGSNDGSNWTGIHTQSGITFGQYEEQEFAIPNQQQDSYRYYRILITASSHDSRTALSLVKLFIVNAEGE